MKNTNVTAVKALMDANKNISVKEICEKTGFSKSQVYAIRHYIKTNPKKKLTPVNKKKAVKIDTNKALRAENDKLHQFCFEWRNKCDAQQKEIARIQHLYMDSQAVVRYLETKIEQLFAE
jgi:DNA-binding transcriptional regulator GbsR (MarR family)